MSTRGAGPGVGQRQQRPPAQARRHGVHPSAPPVGLEVRFRELLVCIDAMGRELTVAGRLRRMVELAVGLGHGEHAALAVRAPDGSLERLVLSSADNDEVVTIRRLLAQHGIEGGEQLPVPAVTTGPRRSGAPVLEVPLHTQFGLYAHLYVFGRAGGSGFTDEDNELLTHFAEVTALGVDNATHLEESRQRQQWLMASAEISRQLLGGSRDEREVWREIAGNVKHLADARTVTISLPSEDDPDELRVEVASGVGGSELEGRHYARAGSLAEQAMTTGDPQIIEAGRMHVVHGDVQPSIAVGQLLAIPLKGRGEARGAIVISRRAGEAPYAARDVRMAEDFAIQAALALELAETRSAQQILETQEDRERIAESLQDQVIQRLFSIGLSLQSTAGQQSTDATRPRLLRAISDIDETILWVRASINPGRQDPRSAAIALLRTTVLDLVAELAELVGFVPEVQFLGALDTVVDVELCQVVGTVLRDALVQSAGRACATQGRVVIAGTDDGISLLLTDDGSAGLSERGEGLAGLWEQAAVRGHSFTVERPLDGGLRLRWLIPKP